MGTHTWFYVKIAKQPSYEEQKEKVIGYYQEEIDFNNRAINDTLTDEDKEFIDGLEHLYDDPDKLKYQNSVYERQIRMINGGYCRKAVLDKCAMVYFLNAKRGVVKAYNGALYSTCDENDNTYMHNLFRVSKYDIKDVLTSYEDYLEFKYKHRDVMYTEITSSGLWFNEEYVDKNMKEWFDKYPESIVDFG